MTDTWADHWNHLATASLLGTDRRPAPEPPPGPLADAVAEAAPADDAESVLTQVALLVAARRAGVRPAPPVPVLAPAAEFRQMDSATLAQTCATFTPDGKVISCDPFDRSGTVMVRVWDVSELVAKYPMPSVPDAE